MTRAVTSSPSSRTVPESYEDRPDRTSRRVVLPEPLGPMSAVTSPGLAPPDTPSRMVLL